MIRKDILPRLQGTSDVLPNHLQAATKTWLNATVCDKLIHARIAGRPLPVSWRIFNFNNQHSFVCLWVTDDETLIHILW